MREIIRQTLTEKRENNRILAANKRPKSQGNEHTKSVRKIVKNYNY